jgi:hypothetical protein
MLTKAASLRELAIAVLVPSGMKTSEVRVMTT